MTAQHGRFTWNELLTRDVAKARAFYGDLLGWTYQDMPMGQAGTYTLIQNGGQNAGGMMPLAAIEGGEELPPHWMSYIAVDDVDVCTARVEALGGRVFKEPFDIPGIGRMSVIADATGAVVCLITLLDPGG